MDRGFDYCPQDEQVGCAGNGCAKCGDVPAAPRQYVMHQHALRPGLRVHVEDVYDERRIETDGQGQSGLHLVVLLEGKLELCYGQRCIHLTASPSGAHPRQRGGAGNQPSMDNPTQAFLLHVRENVPFDFRLCAGAGAQYVGLCMSPDWLRPLGLRLTDRCGLGVADCGLAQLCASHLGLAYWRPTARGLVLAEQILQPPAESAALRALYRESRAIDLLAEVLRSLPAQTGGCAESPEAEPEASMRTRLDPRIWQRMRTLRNWLSSDEASRQPLCEMAQRMGMHASTLQRQFRAAFGVSVGDFVRETSLQRARFALENDGLSVKAVADLAGYGSAANFSTAYKRRFGITPKQARQRARS